MSRQTYVITAIGIIIAFSLSYCLFLQSCLLQNDVNLLLKATSFPFETTERGNRVDQRKQKIAYVITITGCDNDLKMVIDAPAVLAESIRQVPSSYDYELIAFVHPDHVKCARHLPKFGYKVLQRKLGFDPNTLKPPLNILIEAKECCGSIEYLKFESMTLTNFSVVIQLDTDMIILKSFDPLIDAILTGNSTDLPIVSYPNAVPHPDSKHLQQGMAKGIPPPSNKSFDLIFVRDYVQMTAGMEPYRMPIQGGFLVLRPSLARYRHLMEVVLPQSNYWRELGGWQKLGYGNYFSGAQVQGFLSYIYGEIYPTRGLELDMCYYNHVNVAMTKKEHNKDEICLFRHPQTSECRNCREVDLSEIQSYHFVGQAKPWGCGRKMGEIYQTWFRLRKQLEESRGWIVPTEAEYLPNITFGYCNQSRIKGYHPMLETIIRSSSI